MDTRTSLARHWIAGGWRQSDDMAEAESIDPATGQPVGRFAAGGAREAAAAIAAARQAFDYSEWAHNPRVRQNVLLAWAAGLHERREEIANLLTRENGKILRQAEGEIVAAISEIRYYAGLARAVRGSAQEVEPGVFSTVYREAAGVAGIIVPWNGPVLLLIRSLAPALAAGCTAIVKPAAQTALVTAKVMEELLSIAELPRGVVNLVMETGHAAGELLVASEDVDVISFTGSTATGQRIMAAAAPTMKKLSLELGGKSCCLVFADADITAVAPSLAQAATIISGQQCTAARRIVVHASRAAEIKTALRNALADTLVGPGLDRRNQMGPLIDRAARDNVERRINNALDACDEVLLRSRRVGPQEGAFLTPALIAHSDPNAFFCQEEIFGPMVVIEIFETEEEAVAMANNTVFGLAASVWTNDGARALRVASALRNGTVWINDHNRLFAEAEMGGYRRSGLGRLHGQDALLDFTEQKHVYQNVGMLDLVRLRNAEEVGKGSAGMNAMSAPRNVPVLDIDPFDEEVLRNPEPFQEELREAGEFVWLSAYGIWASGRFATVREILRDWKTFGSSGGVGLANFHKEKPWRPPSLVLEHDPPEHTHARSVLMRALATGVVRRLREGFQRVAAAEVERLLDVGHFDAIAELAEGYPLKVFGDAVGITTIDRKTLLEYGNISFNAMGPRNALCLDSMKDERAVTSWVMAQCARDALDPKGLGAIMYAAADQGEITEEEAGMLVRSFLSAGVDTTVKAVGGALDALARNPQQWELLRSTPGLARLAAEEAIRYVSPFQTVFRTASVAVDHGQFRIEPEEKIFLSIGAANHDPRQWDQPNEFQIERKNAGHVGFGAGIHGCAGQMLARLEMEVLFEELARRVSAIELDGESSSALNNTTRGFSNLPIRLIR